MNAQQAEKRFEEIVEHFRKTVLLESTMALLEWDERTGMPAQAGEYRAAQVTLLSGMIHRRKTKRKLGDQLQSLIDSPLASDADSPVAATLQRLWKDYRRNTQLPVSLVEALSRATVLGQQAWERARAQDDWTSFQPHLEEIFSLRRQEADILRGEGTRYDALLDQYEEGARTVELNATFSQLRDELVELVRRLQAVAESPTGAAWQVPVPVPQQRAVSRWIAERIGYQFDRGRLDETTHPFCTTLGPYDCRILTRYQADYFPSGFYSTLHEAGHGLYEQGLPAEWYGLPLGSFASLGVHESQSRLWENFVGRSQSFWKWCFPEVVCKVSPSWDGLNAEQVYRDANRVQPSLIRVEADEVTYNLHILIRFEIEQQLLEGDLPVADAPQAWNERYRHYLGIEPPSAKDGILQDVHWSAGLIGYFPTYTLGNIYAAQLMQAAGREVGPLSDAFERGSFQSLLLWLREKIHRHGFRYPPGKLMELACGGSLDAQPLVDYLRGKLEPIYGL